MGSNPAAPTDRLISFCRVLVQTLHDVRPAYPRLALLVLVSLAVRFGTLALGATLGTLPPDPHSDPNTPAHFRSELMAGSTRVIEPWFRFDALWFMNIARNGYQEAHDEGGRLGPAFMPALPITFAVADMIGLNPFWAGLIVVNALGAFGAAVFARVAARQLGDSGAGWSALALLLSFPTAFFFSAPYNESFGLFFTAVALSAWQLQKCTIGGFAAFGGSLARLTGVSLGVAALVDWLLRPERVTLWRAIALAVGSFAGMLLFWCFLWWAVGDPFAGLKSHAKWGRAELSWKNPFRTIHSIYDPDLPHWGEGILVLGTAILGIRAWLKRGAFWGIVTLVPIAQMFASGTLLSGHRVVLAVLPAFIELADLLRGRRTLYAALLVIFALAQITLLNRYVHWQFAG